MSSEMSVPFVSLSWETWDMCVSWQTLTLTSPLRDETSEEFSPFLSLALCLPSGLTDLSGWREALSLPLLF